MGGRMGINEASVRDWLGSCFNDRNYEMVPSVEEMKALGIYFGA